MRHGSCDAEKGVCVHVFTWCVPLNVVYVFMCWCACVHVHMCLCVFVCVHTCVCLWCVRMCLFVCESVSSTAQSPH